MLELKLEEKREMSCEEVILASVAIWFKRRYEMIYSQFWRFKLATEDPKYRGFIGRRILVETGDPEQLLEQYHGIRVTKYEDISSEKVLKIAEKNLKAGIPVITSFKYEYASWAPPGEKYHYEPFFVTGIDHGKQLVHCIDVHFLKKAAVLPLANFLQGCRGCTTFSLVHPQKEALNWREILKDNLHYLNQHNAFDSLRELAELMGSLDYTLETIEKDVFEPPILARIKQMYRSRFLFPFALQYLDELHQAQGLLRLSEEFVRLANRWMSVWSLVNKGFYEKDFESKRKKLSEKVLEIADHEERLYHAALQIIDGGNQTPGLLMNQVQSERVIEEFVFIELGEFLNNEGFAVDMQLNRTVNLNGMKRAEYMLTGGLPENECWDIQGLQFHFPRPQDGTVDNISCHGQIIPVTKDEYSAIMVLGCAEWGSQAEFMKLYDGEGKMVKAPLEFSDWSYKEPVFGEIPAWEGDCAFRSDEDGSVQVNHMFKAHLFAKKIPLEFKMQIERIELPDCSNIHIFALTLGK